MADTSLTIGSIGKAKKLVDLGDSTFADAAVLHKGTPGTTQVLAKATGSTNGMGKVADLANTETIYVRCGCSGQAYSQVDWTIQNSAQADIAFYRARAIEDEVTLTLASFADTNTIILNGLTITGEATATDAAYASRKFNVGGSDTADATALAALINADYAVVTAGTSVAGTDKLTFVTDEGTKTITAAATADYEGSKYGLNATAATELASIVLAINHKDNVTCASVSVGDTVVVGGITYTAAATENTTTHTFAQITSDDATGTSLAACVNADTATHGITATNASGVVSFTRGTEAATVGLSTSNATRLATESAGGVPGVVAAATGATAELSITPTWTSTLTVTESGDRLTCTDIDVPGIYATSADAVVTLVPGTPASRTTGDLASVIQATAAANCTVSQAATLLGLVAQTGGITPSTTVNIADNNDKAGALYEQEIDGWEYAYAAVYADGGTTTVVVNAIPRV